ESAPTTRPLPPLALVALVALRAVGLGLRGDLIGRGLDLAEVMDDGLASADGLGTTQVRLAASGIGLLQVLDRFLQRLHRVDLREVLEVVIIQLERLARLAAVLRVALVVNVAEVVEGDDLVHLGGLCHGACLRAGGSPANRAALTWGLAAPLSGDVENLGGQRGA